MRSGSRASWRGSPRPAGARARSPPSSAWRSRRSSSTCANLGAVNAGPYLGRRAIVEMLARGGVRVSELCDIRMRDARLHDRDGSRVRIPDASTEAGDTRGPAHARPRRRPDRAPPTTSCRRSADRAGRLPVPEHPRRPHRPPARRQHPPPSDHPCDRAARRAGPPAAPEHHAAHAPPDLHLDRRARERLRRQVVMSQVGHADSKMTMDVYAQLEQRVERRHGTAFDELVRAAIGQQADAELGHGLATRAFRGRKPNRYAVIRAKKSVQKRASRNGETRTRTGDTTIFSRVLYQLSYLARRNRRW
jgi:hypothetical protein